MTQAGSSNARSGVKGFIAIPLETRFWARVDMSGGPDACWPWRGAKKQGYGTIWDGARTRRATQVAWELTHGRPFPEGKFACHACDNPPCCNPDHIWPGTHAENMRDAVLKGRFRFPTPEACGKVNRLKTLCPEGHPLSGENLKLDRHGSRVCRVCARASTAKWAAKKPLTEAQRRMLLASGPDDITGEEGVGVELTIAYEYNTANALQRRGLGHVQGPGGPTHGMYWNNAEGLRLRARAALSQEPSS